METGKLGIDLDKFGMIMVGGNWGTQLASGDNFYRLLFRYEKRSSLTVEEVNSMLASYKSWKTQIDAMRAECHTNSTMEDRKAISYAVTLNDDIIKHIDTILATVKCDDNEYVQKIVTKANTVTRMKE